MLCKLIITITVKCILCVALADSTCIISAVALIRGLMLKKHGGLRLCLKSVLKNSTMFTRLSLVV